MARAAGTAAKRDKAPDGEGGAPAPKPARAVKGHNLPKMEKITADDIRAYASALVVIQAEADIVKVKRKALRDQWSAKGMPLQIVDRRLKRSSWKPQEITEDWDTERFVAESLGQPIGKQLELLGDERTPDAVREGLRWRAEGKMHGLLGRHAPEQPPEGCPPEHDAMYAEGWEEGQAETQQAVLRNLEKNNAGRPN